MHAGTSGFRKVRKAGAVWYTRIQEDHQRAGFRSTYRLVQRVQTGTTGCRRVREFSGGFRKVHECSGVYRRVHEGAGWCRMPHEGARATGGCAAVRERGGGCRRVHECAERYIMGRKVQEGEGW